MKRWLFLIAVAVWLVIWLGLPLVSTPTVHIELPQMHTTSAVISALALNMDAIAEAAAKAKPPWRRWWDRIWRILNFLILIFFLVKVLREPTKKFFADQRQSRKAELEELENLREEAEAEYRRVEDKLTGLSLEIEELKTQFADRGERMKDEVLTQARYESELILRKTEAAAQARVRVSRERLREEIIELAAAEAERILTRAITADDQRRMLDEYLSGLKTNTGR